MPIRTDAELEQAMQEFQRLADAGDGTPEARRRDELNAAIEEYAMRRSGDLRTGRPPEKGPEDAL